MCDGGRADRQCWTLEGRTGGRGVCGEAVRGRVGSGNRPQVRHSAASLQDRRWAGAGRAGAASGVRGVSTPEGPFPPAPEDQGTGGSAPRGVCDWSHPPACQLARERVVGGVDSLPSLGSSWCRNSPAAGQTLVWRCCPMAHLAQAVASVVGAPAAAQGSRGDSRRTGDGDGSKDTWQAGALPRGSSLRQLGLRREGAPTLVIQGVGCRTLGLPPWLLGPPSTSPMAPTGTGIGRAGVRERGQRALMGWGCLQEGPGFWLCRAWALPPPALPPSHPGSRGPADEVRRPELPRVSTRSQAGTPGLGRV